MDTLENLQNQPLSALLEPYEIWLKWGNPGKPYSDHTIRSYLREVRSFLAFLDENMIESVDEITNAVFRQYFARMAQKGVKPSTTRSKLSALDSFFEWGYLEEIFPINPADRYKRLISRQGRGGGRSESRLPESLSEKQVDDLIFSIMDENRKETDRNLAVVGILLDTGIRVSELLNMTIQSGIDLAEGRKVRIYGKGRKERLITAGKAYRDLYVRYINEKAQESEGLQAPLFTSKKGQPLTQDRVYRMIARHLGKIGVETHQKGAHLLRHTAATLMLKNGAVITTVQHLLGHSNVATTGKYLHLIES